MTESRSIREQSAQRFGNLVRTQREKQGITQEELGLVVGTSLENISSIERGRNLNPNTDLIGRLMSALRIDPVDVLVAFGWIGDEKDIGVTDHDILGFLDWYKHQPQEIRRMIRGVLLAMQDGFFRLSPFVAGPLPERATR